MIMCIFLSSNVAVHLVRVVVSLARLSSFDQEEPQGKCNGREEHDGADDYAGYGTARDTWSG